MSVYGSGGRSLVCVVWRVSVPLWSGEMVVRKFGYVQQHDCGFWYGDYVGSGVCPVTEDYATVSRGCARPRVNSSCCSVVKCHHLCGNARPGCPNFGCHSYQAHRWVPRLPLRCLSMQSLSESLFVAVAE